MVPAGSAGPHPRERRLESHAGTDEPPRRLPRNLLRLLCSRMQFSKLYTSTRTFASFLFAENRCWQQSQPFARSRGFPEALRLAFGSGQEIPPWGTRVALRNLSISLARPRASRAFRVPTGSPSVSAALRIE